MSYPPANIEIRGKTMNQNTPTTHNNPTLHPPEFDLVARDDPIGTLDRNSGLCACLNLATHQLVNHGHPLPADMVVELAFHPQEVLAEMSAGKQPRNCCVWCGWAFLDCYPDSWHASRLRFDEFQGGENT